MIPARAMLPRVLKEDEVAALLDRIPATDPLALRDRAAFELAYASGLRAEELTTLSLHSVDFDSECVRAYHTVDPDAMPDGNVCVYLWPHLVRLFGAIQLAGPKLTAQTVQAGLFAQLVTAPGVDGGGALRL